MAIPIKSPDEIDAIARAGALLWRILETAIGHLGPGMTTAEVDAAIEEQIREGGAVPVMRGYRGRNGDAPPFPGVSAISINEEVVHAIPGPRIIRGGDLLTIDCALSLGGWCCDAAISTVVGEATDGRTGLVEAARAAVWACIDAAAAGRKWSEVAAAGVRACRAQGAEVHPEFAGHGIGRRLHEQPEVSFNPRLQSAGAGGLDFVLRPGMVLTIEPVVVRAQTRMIGMDDGWTVVTADRSPAAHEERTIAVGRRGARVLTA